MLALAQCKGAQRVEEYDDGVIVEVRTRINAVNRLVLYFRDKGVPPALGGGGEVTFPSADDINVQIKDGKELRDEPFSLYIPPSNPLLGDEFLVWAVGRNSSSDEIELGRAAAQVRPLPGQLVRVVLTLEAHIDADNDGFPASSGCGAEGQLPCDCDDARQDVSPWRLEDCGDPADNNCGGVPYNDGCPCESDAFCSHPDVVEQEQLGVGRCRWHVLSCEGGVLKSAEECDAEGPVPEVPNNLLDDDCDGSMDEGSACNPVTEPQRHCVMGWAYVEDGHTQAALEERAQSNSEFLRWAVGECTPGVQLCEAGVWGECSAKDVRPTLNADPEVRGFSEIVDDPRSSISGVVQELCDGLDNDCDGFADNERVFDSDGDGYTSCGTRVQPLDSDGDGTSYCGTPLPGVDALDPSDRLPTNAEIGSCGCSFAACPEADGADAFDDVYCIFDATCHNLTWAADDHFLDCNDSLLTGADIHPGATELCGDNIDQNCRCDHGDSGGLPLTELGVEPPPTRALDRNTGRAGAFNCVDSTGAALTALSYLTCQQKECVAASGAPDHYYGVVNGNCHLTQTTVTQADVCRDDVDSSDPAYGRCYTRAEACSLLAGQGSTFGACGLSCGQVGSCAAFQETITGSEVRRVCLNGTAFTRDRPLCSTPVAGCNLDDTPGTADDTLEPQYGLVAAGTDPYGDCADHATLGTRDCGSTGYCQALVGEPCGGNIECRSGYCRADWDGATYCADDATSCVYDPENDGIAVDRDQGYVECEGDVGSFVSRVCDGGAWEAQVACGLCAPSGEVLGCGFHAGCSEGPGGGCSACTDCGRYAATAGGCPLATVANCEVQCGDGAVCQSGQTSSVGRYCEGGVEGDSYDQVDYCDNACVWADEIASGGADPTDAPTLIACGGYDCVSGNCLTTCVTSADCNNAYYCNVGVCLPKIADGLACTTSPADQCASGSGNCRTDWDGTGTFCAYDATSCVYDSDGVGGTAALDRDNGWEECEGSLGTFTYRSCASGVWSGSTACGLCAPAGEVSGCGYHAACTDGLAGGCASCTDCGPHTASASGCNSAVVANCETQCGDGAVCESGQTNSGGFFCDALEGDRYERIDSCADTCLWQDESGSPDANDLLNQACGVYDCSGGACLNPCSTSSDCNTGYYCNAGACLPKIADGMACTTSPADQCLSGSGNCRTDWDGTGTFCAYDATSCVYDSDGAGGTAALDRDNGWEECEGSLGTFTYRSCASGVWSGSTACGLCAPGGEGLGCGYHAACTDGLAGGCASCTDCGSYTASTSACNSGLANCSTSCGAQCQSGQTSSAGFFCTATEGDAYERIDSCVSSCTWFDETGAPDANDIVTACGVYDCSGGACVNPCSLDTDCNTGYYCASGSCLPVGGTGSACTANNQCSSSRCRTDWDGTGRFCADDATSCVYDDDGLGATPALDRDNGVLECVGATHKTCAIGVWGSTTTCTSGTCDPDGGGSETSSCGYRPATCTDGSGCASCGNCGPYTASASGCNSSITDCSITCGAQCTNGQTTSAGFFCDALEGDRYERIDSCASTCTWFDEVGDPDANDTLNQACGLHDCSGGACVIPCVVDGDCNTGNVCTTANGVCCPSGQMYCPGSGTCVADCSADCVTQPWGCAASDTCMSGCGSCSGATFACASSAWCTGDCTTCGADVFGCRSNNECVSNCNTAGCTQTRGCPATDQCEGSCLFNCTGFTNDCDPNTCCP